MREVIEKRVLIDIDRLRDGLKKTRVDVGALHAQGEDLKATVRKHREDLRLASERMDTMQNGADKLRQALNEVEAVATEAEQTIQDTRQRFGQTNNNVQKCMQDGVSLRSRLEALGADHAKVCGLVQNTHQDLEKVTSRLQASDIRFMAKCSIIDSNTQNIQECSRQLETLKAWSDHSKEIQMSLQVQGQELQVGLHKTQQTLKETNAMVLPNLERDTSGAAMLRNEMTSPNSVRGVSLAKAQRRKQLTSPVPSLALRASSVSTMAESMDQSGGWF
jgi:chromosome segregation ATPase